MKGLGKIIYFLFLSALLLSCDNEVVKNIEFSEESKAVVEQTIPYNSLSAKSVTFTTLGPWAAQIVFDELVDSLPSVAYNRSNAQENGNELVESWLSINPDRGDAAGKYTMNIVLKENNSNADRTAYVIIRSGDTETKITIKQACKANSNATEDNDDKNEPIAVLKYIDKVTIKSLDYYDDLSIYDIKHQYDEQNRIVGVTKEWSDGEECSLRHCSFEYAANGNVNMTIVRALPYTADDILDKAVATMGKNGLVKSIDILDNYSEATMNLGYDSNGHITSLQEIYHSDNFSYTTPFEYADGCLAKIDNEAVPSYYFANRYENDKINVDINNFLLNGYNIDVLSMFMYARMCGSMGDYIIEDAVSGELYSMVADANAPVSDPNYSRLVEYYTYKKINEFVDTDYIFDEEGCPVKLNVKHKYQQYKNEYTLKAGNVIFNKEGVNYYEIVKTPEKETPTNVIKDTYIEYIFEYK